MSGGGVPANTSSTTTVNQSPWQNQTYRTLALGNSGNLGPVAQQLKIGQQLTQDWMDIQSGRNPGLYYGMPDATPAQVAEAAAGRDVGFAGGRASDVSGHTKPMAVDAQSTEAQTAAEGGIMNLRGFAAGGAPKEPKTPKDPKAPQDINKQQAAWLERANSQAAAGTKLPPQQEQKRDFLNQRRTNYTNYQTQQQNQQDEAVRNRPYSYSDLATPTAFLDPTTGQNMLPDAQLAYKQARSLSLPPQIQQATGAYNEAISGLRGMTNYSPSQVGGTSVNRGDIRDINAIMADVEKYRAAGMEPPPDLQAEAYQAAQMQGAEMTGPASWTQAGIARQYMNPYTQNVLDQELFEANRQAQMRENQQRSQASQQKAFGGSRAALQESEGRRNLGYLLSDIEQKGLQQAYGQGMQQFQAESGLSQQAKQANLQGALQTQQQNQAAVNQQRSQYVAQALQAAQTSYGGRLTAAQQNQVAQNAASQFNAQSQNQAYNNYVQQQLAAQQSNQQMDWNTAQLNAQLAQQAQISNQSAGLQANQQNLGAWGSMGNMAQGLGGLGATQNQIQLNNLGALGQSATAQTNYAQGALDRQTQNAINYFNLPTTFNAAGINALNAQPVSGGTNTSNQWYNQARPFAKGGKVKWGPKK
jgi:hypothetical protein